MKKIYVLLSAAFLFGGQVFAQNKASNQVVESQSNVTDKMETLPVSIDDIATLKNTYLKGKREETVYFDYIDEARTFGESYVYFSGMFMWPDSLPLTANEDEDPSNIFYHGGGSMFDPASDFLEVNLDATTWSRHTRYTVDSAFVFYKYHNFGNTKDTLLFTFTKDANVAQLSFNSGANPTASVRYDKNTNRVMAPDATQTIIFDSSDNTSNFFSTDFNTFSSNSFELGIDLDVEPVGSLVDYANLFGMTVQFLPGKGADSLNQPLTFDDSTNLDSNNLSLFSPLVMRGTRVTQEDASHNFALLLYSQQRYTDRPTEWFGVGNAPGNDRVFTYTIFKMNGVNVGINEINDDVSFALSPNPISSGETLKADFKLRKSSNVTISISDSQGKEVKVLTHNFYAPGEHLVDGDISDLNSGVYFYNINTEYGSTSKKFIVQ